MIYRALTGAVPRSGSPLLIVTLCRDPPRVRVWTGEGTMGARPQDRLRGPRGRPPRRPPTARI